MAAEEAISQVSKRTQSNHGHVTLVTNSDKVLPLLLSLIEKRGNILKDPQGQAAQTKAPETLKPLAL